MKLQKLDNRFKYFKYGFTHLLILRIHTEAEIAEKYLTDIYGKQPYLERDYIHHPWFIHWSAIQHKVYVKDEKAIMMIQLMI